MVPYTSRADSGRRGHHPAPVWWRQGCYLVVTVSLY